MSKELVVILGEYSFPEKITEVFQYATRGQQADDAEKKRRGAFIQRAAEAESEPNRQRIVVKEVLNELKTFNEGNDRELEGIFNLITSLIVSNNSDEEATPLLSHVCSILTEEASAGASVDRSLVRYRILSNIFNSLPSSSSNRYNVFVSLLELANKNDELEVIADAISSIPCWLSEWNISAQEKAALLESVATKLQEAEQGAKAYDFLLTHLRYISTSTISGKDASSAETKAAAEKTIAAALNLVNVFDFEELSQVEAVKQLQDEPVGKLLTICISGTSKDWRSWKDANKSEMERLGLSSELLERKIKLLDLASLCSQSISSEVPYTEIAKTLEIESDQVEIWVIDVIRAGLVSGKLSQINQSLRVYKSVYRSFDLDQWKLLEKRLSTWESSITNILSTIAESKESASVLPRDVGIPGADSATVNVNKQYQAPSQQIAV